MDFASPEQRARYPKHGWAKNSQGYGLLWFPLTRLAENMRTFRKAKGITTPMSRGDEEERRPLVNTLVKYIIALRELHKVIRVACDYPVDTFDSEPPEATSARHHAFEISPLLTDLAIVYLRRLADRITITTRPLLFRRYKSAPREYKNLTKLVDGTGLSKLDPICDVEELQKVIREHSGWFDALCGISPAGKKGLRDALEHRGTALWPSMGQTGTERPTYEMSLQSGAGDVERRQDVLEFIQECNAELCTLMSGLCRAAEQAGAYESRDAFLIIGDDADTTGFWPEI